MNIFIKINNISNVKMMIFNYVKIKDLTKFVNTMPCNVLKILSKKIE